MRPFVGRVQELADLASALEEAASGRGSLVLVTGEPGIGKTRLMSELARVGSERGVRVVTGRCWEEGGAPPYWPWLQVIRALGGDLEELVVRTGSTGGPALDADRGDAGRRAAAPVRRGGRLPDRGLHPSARSSSSWTTCTRGTSPRCCCCASWETRWPRRGSCSWRPTGRPTSACASCPTSSPSSPGSEGGSRCGAWRRRTSRRTSRR